MYPNDEHEFIASPEDVELAAAGVPILASNIKGHLELENLIWNFIFQHDNFRILKKIIIFT